MRNAKVIVQGHKWYIRSEPSKLGDKYVSLERVSFMADLRRYGQVATRIDVLKEELANRIPAARTA